jgi:hypothetical protein
MLASMREPKPRRFTSLNHPELTAAGTQLYAVFEVFEDPAKPQGRRYVRVADNLTQSGVELFIKANGVHDA